MTAKQKHGAVLGLALLLVTAPAMAVPQTQNCGQLQAASNAAKNQQSAITQGALKVFKPQPSVSMMSCLRNLMSTHVGLGMFGFNPGAILGELENEACAAAEGSVSNVESQIGQNLSIPGARIGGPGSPLYVPGAGANANLGNGNGSSGATLNGSPVTTGTSWQQIQQEIFR